MSPKDHENSIETGISWIQNNVFKEITDAQRKLNFELSLKFLKEGRLQSFSPEVVEFSSNIDNFTRVHVDFGLPISKFKIKNVKSFKNLSLEPSGLNLFAGKNSSGKSTILETLALLSNWSHTKNTVYDGIPFKFDFGIKNLKEFKSNLANESENINLEIVATNTINSSDEILGNANISISIDSNQSQLELKHAPIKSINLHFDNNNKFGKDDFGFVPVNIVVDYQKQNDQSKYLKDLFDTGSNIMINHQKKKAQLDESDQNRFIELIKSEFPEDAAKRFLPAFESRMSKIYNLHNYEKINKKIEEDKILDHYVDISVCSEASGLRSTRLYGASFSSGEKKFYDTQVNFAESIIPIDKTFLIRWLAIDYIEKHADQKLVLEIHDLGLPDVRDYTEELLRKNKTYRNDLESHLYEKITPPSELTRKIRKKILKELEILNLNIAEDGTYEFRGFFDFLKDSYEKKLNKININNLIEWIKQGNPSLELIEENKAFILENIEKQSIYKKGNSNLKQEFSDYFEVSTNVLQCADNAIIKLSRPGTVITDVLESMYSDIDSIFNENRIMKPRIYSDWQEIKHFILEILSQDTLMNAEVNDEEIQTDKNVLISFDTSLHSKEPLVGFDGFYKQGMFSNINSSMNKSLENLFSTIFIGPLRERSDFADDVFSYEYPLTLGMKGEKSLSFLTTFKNNKILFPAPKLIEDISNLKPEKIDGYLKLATYEDHLSTWLEYLQLAEKIIISNDGKIEIFQNSDNDNKTSLDNLGVGVSQVLPVLLACMITQKNEEEEILLLEQPELHLHPSAQAKLADFFIAVSITKRKTLFVETHSEHILNRLRLRKIQLKDQKEFIKIFFTTRDGNVETDIEEFTINKDGSYDFESYPEGFFDQTQIESREIAKALLDEMNKN